jgi:hypothetical protein
MSFLERTPYGSTDALLNATASTGKQRSGANESKLLCQPMKNLPEYNAEGTTDAGYEHL